MFTNVTIAISGCPYVEFFLNNGVLRKQGSLQGIYRYNGIVNEKHSWKLEDQAIWFIPEFKDWAIGDLENIGGKKHRIRSTGDQDADLFSIPKNKWQYFDDGWKSVPSGDVVINCVQGKAQSDH